MPMKVGNGKWKLLLLGTPDTVFVAPFCYFFSNIKNLESRPKMDCLVLPNVVLNIFVATVDTNYFVNEWMVCPSKFKHDDDDDEIRNEDFFGGKSFIL